MSQPQANKMVSFPMIFCVGSNHRTASIATRESFFLNDNQIEKIISHWLNNGVVSEIFILSTCNRCEIFGVASHDSLQRPDELSRFYFESHDLVKSKNVLPISPQSVYSFVREDAILHAHRVAASLDSLVPGETQITGQFKDSVALAKSLQGIGPILNRLSQESLAVTKKVRTQTDIGRHRVSISHAAIDLAKHASENLSNLRFLIIGAGEMARVAAEYAASYKPKQLGIVNRTRQKAFELVGHIGFGESFGFDQLYDQINRSDVVICATSAPNFVVDYRNLSSSQSQHRERSPLFLIDISLPRTIDPKVTEIDDVYLFDIDDLKQVVDRHLEKRREALVAAQDIVKEHSLVFEKWIYQQSLGPTISNGQQYFLDTIARDMKKSLDKSIFAALDESQRKSLDQFVESTASKLAGDFASHLKSYPTDEVAAVALFLDQIFKRRSP